MSAVVRPAMTLPGRYYTDPQIFAAEMERFFINRWVCVGRQEQLREAGAYFLAEVAGESVIITRDKVGGHIRAFYNVCRHRGTRICEEPEGEFPNCRIRCPYHAWTYRLDGALIAAPQMDADFSKADYPLHEVKVEEWEGHVFVHLGQPSRSVTEQLASLTAQFAPWRMGELQQYSRIKYDVKANWKLIVSNYNECLHCPVLHPALNKLTDYMGADNVAPTSDFIGGSMGFKAGVETMSHDGVRRRDYLPGLNEAQRGMVAYYVIYPNLLLSLHPDYMMTHTLWPRAVDRTEIVCAFHFHPDEIAKPEFVAQDASRFWDQTNREDWHISELSQRGVSSRAYTPGPYSKREELLWAFDQMVLSGQ